jgi:hypothetical protein
MEKRTPAGEQWMSNALDISVDAARDLTKLIKGKLEGILDQVHEVHQLILEAHDRRAWQALGYPTWQAYVKKEFNLSRSRSYQLLDRAKVHQVLLAAGCWTQALILEDSGRLPHRAATQDHIIGVGSVLAKLWKSPRRRRPKEGRSH